ncbi:MAG: Ig-like domain-containing protein [Clostridia bacterium]|nr:Ig-like domain-containing protein [Clostridia bacterium]
MTNRTARKTLFIAALAIVFALAMTFAFNPARTDTLKVEAASNISYIDENGSTKTASANQITKHSNKNTFTSGWYYASGNVEMNIDYDFNISGDVKIILVNGATLHQYNPVHIPAGSTLTIYGQTTGDNMGKMRVTDPYNTTVDGEGTLIVRSGWLDVQRTASGSPAVTCATEIYGGKTTVYGLTSTAIAGNVTLGKNMVVKAGDSSGSVSLVENYETNHGHRYAMISKKVNVSGLSFSNSSVNVNNGGDVIRYLPTVAPNNASYNELRYITWSSSNESVATVNANGYVQPVGAGTTTITATATNGTTSTSDDKKATYTVKVVNPTAVSYLKYNEETGTFTTAKCTAYQPLTTQRTWGTEGFTRWYVVESNQSLFKQWYTGSNLEPQVDVLGDVHLIIKDGVKLSVDSHGIKLASGASLTIYAQSTGSNMGELYANGTTGEGAYPGWNPGNPGIDADGATLTVNGCRVTGQAGRNDIGISCQHGGKLIVNGGEVTGHARYGNIHAGLGDPEGIGGINSTIIVNGGKVYADIPYEDWGYAIGCAPRWGWSNITINGGEVTAYATPNHKDSHAFGGTVKISEDLKIKAGGSRTTMVVVGGYGGQTCAYIRTKVDVAGLTLKSATTLTAGDASEQLNFPGFLPSNTTYDDARFVYWTSSDPSIASVDQNGLITPHTPGTATITVTATNGTETTEDDKSATCVVTVKYPTAVKYRDYSENGTYLGEKTCPLYYNLAYIGDSWGEAGRTIWYVAKSDKDVGRANVVGDVRLIIMDGVTINCKAGITVDGNNSLTIYSQSARKDNTGKIISGHRFESWQIGYDNAIGGSGSVIINGATIDATGGRFGGGLAGKVTINDGDVYAHTDHYGHALCGTITLNGGKVRASGDSRASSLNGTLISADYMVILANGTTPVRDPSRYVYFENFDAVPVTGISPAPASIELKVNGPSETISATFAPANASYNTQQWLKFSSSDPSVATVDKNGVVSPVSAGTAVITITATNGTETTADDHSTTCTVNVIFVNAKVEIDQSTLELRVNGPSAKLNHTITNEDASVKTVVWSSSDPSVATVDQNGVVKPGFVHSDAPRTVNITVTATNGTEDTSDDSIATCAVTVYFACTEITLDKTTLELEANRDSAKLTYTLTNNDATDKSVVWSSSDPSIATVDQKGVIRPIWGGTVTITVTATNDIDNPNDDTVATCTVTVSKISVTDVTLNETSLSLIAKGASAQLTATLTPTEVSYNNIVWSSSDPSVAKVGQNGVVTPLQKGTAIITVTATNYAPDPDDDVSTTCTVTVELPETVPYLTYNADEKTFDTAECTLYAVVSNTYTWGENGQTSWYVAKTDANIGYVTVVGDVRLIICNNVTLTAGNFYLNGDSSLTIYVQSNDEATMGKLTCAGISGGTITIHGGTVTSTGAGYGAGITGKNITIHSGIITATGVNNGAGIGVDSNSSLTINGGTVTATGAGYGAGIGGSGSAGDAGTITINGGVVTATGDKSSAGIGGAGCDDMNWGGHGGNITINGGEVIAQSKAENVEDYEIGRGIGGGGRSVADRSREFSLTIGEGLVAIGSDSGPVWNDYQYALRSATVRVTAILDVTGVTLDQSSLELFAGNEAVTLHATVSPIESRHNIVWTSSDPSVAKVDKNGAVTPLKKGTAVIKATATNGTSDTSDDYFAECTVTVDEKPQVKYFEYDAGTRTYVEKTTTMYRMLTSDVHYLGSNDSWSADYNNPVWYYAEEDCTIVGEYDGRLNVNGYVFLIIKDGVTVTASNGIYLNNSWEGSSKLIICTQSTDVATMGKLIANGNYYAPGLSGSGTITVNGGIVTATGSNYEYNDGTAGIGPESWYDTDPGPALVVNGGVVTAIGSKNFMGIQNSKIQVNGGTLIAQSNNNVAISGGSIRMKGTLVYAGEDEASAVLVTDFPGNRDYKYVSITSDPDYDPALDVVKYLVFDVNTRTYTEKALDKFEYVESDLTALGNWQSGNEFWYYADMDVTFNDNIRLQANINLILKDGVTVTFGNGIEIEPGATLSIYAQSNDPDKMGKLIVRSDWGHAIGGDYGFNELNIHGGNIFATGSDYNAAIYVETVNVYGGIVKAVGGEDASGIGRPEGPEGLILNVYNGNLEAIGNNGAEAIDTAGSRIRLVGMFVYASYDGADTAEQVFDFPENPNYSYVSLVADPDYVMPDVSGLTINQHELDLLIGGGKGYIIATVTPDDANQTVVWSSSDESVATVNNGVITAVGEGTAIITVTATNGTEDTADDLVEQCVVTVTKPAPVSYLDYDEETGEFVERVCDSYIIISPETAVLSDGTPANMFTDAGKTPVWCVVFGTVELVDPLFVMGDVHLILTDGSRLNANMGICVEGANSLTIYAQSIGDEMGKLRAYGEMGSAGIGAMPRVSLGREKTSADCGTVTINGGNITAIGTDVGAGIGGSGGVLDFNTWSDGPAGKGGTITINGGIVTAIGGENRGVAIGSGYDYNSNGYSDHGTLIIRGEIMVFVGDDDDSLIKTTALSSIHTKRYAIIGGDGPTYAINVEETANGTVEVKDQSAAEKTVTITILPEAGYKLSEITLKSGTINAINSVDDLIALTGRAKYEVGNGDYICVATDGNGKLFLFYAGYSWQSSLPVNGQITFNTDRADEGIYIVSSYDADWGHTLVMEFHVENGYITTVFVDGTDWGHEDILVCTGVSQYALATTYTLTTVTPGKVYEFTMPANAVTVIATFEEVAAHAHDDTTLEFVEAKEPTCTEDGNVAHYLCKECGRYFADANGQEPVEYQSIVIAALGHDLVRHDGKEATCTEAGYKAYDTCSRCDYTTYKEIAALGHDADEVVETVDPTCTEQGYTVYKCSHCGENFNKDYVDALGHDASEFVETVDPTCMEQGYSVYKCSHCGETFQKDFVDAVGHEAGELIETVEATCTEGGYTVYKCLHCGENYETDHVDALGHEAGDWSITKEPTCTENGFKVKYCTHCGEVLESEEIDLVEHSFSDWEAVVEPTCTEKGRRERICSVCDEIESEEIDTIGHTFGDWIVTDLPTCTEKGSKHKVCSGCGEEIVEEIDAIGHTVSEWQIAKEPTCIETGAKHKVCTVCDEEVEVEELATVAHTESEEWVITLEPTCTEKGSKHLLCSVCGEELDVVDIAALGHTFGEWTTTKEATATEEGSEERECTVCHEKESRYIPLAGHTHTITFVEAKDATCEEGGNIAHYICSECGRMFIDENGEISINPEDVPSAPLGHDYIEEVTDSTCKEHGHVKVTCSHCDYEAIEELPFADHTYGDWVVTKEPQIGVRGEETRTCTVCGATETRDVASLPYIPVIEEDGTIVYKEDITEEAKDVTDLFKQANEECGAVEVKAGELVIVFDEDAVTDIGAAEEAVTISAKVSAESDKVENAELVLEVTLEGATFVNGEATVSIPFEKEVPAGKVAKVYYIADDGTMTDMNATFENGKVTFTTNHFSTYAVIFEEEHEESSVNDVIDLIAAIGTVEYTAESKGKIDEARAAYDALTAGQKALVDNYETLTTAESTYAALKAEAESAEPDQEAVNAVKEMIAAIGTVEFTPECKAKISEARIAYVELSGKEKDLVDNYDVLMAAEDAYLELVEGMANTEKHYHVNCGGNITMPAIGLMLIAIAVSFVIFRKRKENVR